MPGCASESAKPQFVNLVSSLTLEENLDLDYAQFLAMRHFSGMHF